ncbi:MAG: hypothetical protein AAB444_02715 [Patescibacteria group bacterium]
MRITSVFVFVGEIAGAISLVLAVAGVLYVCGLALDPLRQTELMKLAWWQIAVSFFFFSVIAITAEEIGDRRYRRSRLQ